MDNLQAAILNYRLGKQESVIQKRRSNARSYLGGINMVDMYIPEEKTYEYNTYHTFVVQTEYRDKLKEHLFSNGIDTAIHYPIPIHLQLASKKLGYKEGDFLITEKQSKQILTLPINQFLSEVDLERIISVINQFEKDFL
jgi:dTDP-4-amino-4,6-dideoxygalactose transaminase